MASHVLVPLDDSPLSFRALEFAAREHGGARITLVHVIDPLEVVYEAEVGGPAVAEAWYESALEAASEMFDRARERIRDSPATIDETEVLVGKPGPEIVSYVDEHDVDHVVMGSHGREGISRMVLGSVAETVVRRAPTPVTVVR